MSQHDDSIDISAAVVASSPDAIIAADMNGTIIGWNPAAEEMLGFTADQAIGRQLLSLMPEDQRQEAARLLDRARDGEVVAGREVTRTRQDGSTVIGRLTLAPIRGANGEIHGSPSSRLSSRSGSSRPSSAGRTNRQTGERALSRSLATNFYRALVIFGA